MKKLNNSMRLIIYWAALSTASAFGLLVEPGVVQSQLDTAQLVADVLVTDLSASPDPIFRATLLAHASIENIVRSATSARLGDTIGIFSLGGELGNFGVMFSGFPRPYVGSRYRAYLNLRADGHYEVAGYDRGLSPLSTPSTVREMWTRNRTDGSNGTGTGPYLYWNDSYLPLSYFVSVPTFKNFSSFPAAIDASFKTWRDPQDVKLEYVGLGCTSNNVQGSEGINTVIYVSQNWQYDPSAIAITRNFYVAGNNPQSGLILDSDILLNGANHQFTTTNELGKHDVQNIVTHEAGHFIGLGHDVDPDADPDATMYATASPNEYKKRTLKADDLSALHAAYAGVGNKGDFQHVTCNLPDGGPTSCASSRGPASFAPWRIVAAILYFGFLFLIPMMARSLTYFKRRISCFARVDNGLFGKRSISSW
jgi:hypothetical protein